MAPAPQPRPPRAPVKPAPPPAPTPPSATRAAVSARTPAKPAQPAPPPPDPAERALQLVTVMERLGGLLVHELAQIRAGAFAGVVALQSEKGALSTRLDELGRMLRLDPTGLAALSPELRQRLTEAGRRLDQIAAASHETLDIQVEAQKCVVDTVVVWVNRERRLATDYGHVGRSAPPPAARMVGGRAVTFNATL